MNLLKSYAERAGFMPKYDYSAEEKSTVFLLFISYFSRTSIIM